MSEGPVPISVGQLLVINPNAYVNLTLQFPDASYDEKNPPKKLEDIQAYELPSNFKLLLVGPREAVVVSRNPPGIFAFDEKELKWKPVKVAPEKG